MCTRGCSRNQFSSSSTQSHSFLLDGLHSGTLLWCSYLQTITLQSHTLLTCNMQCDAQNAKHSLLPMVHYGHSNAALQILGRCSLLTNTMGVKFRHQHALSEETSYSLKLCDNAITQNCTLTVRHADSTKISLLLHCLQFSYPQYDELKTWEPSGLKM
jgi:hypothetical protein